MRILYGVQGTGNGHISRARAMAPALEKQGVEVDYLFSGRPPEQYFDMAPFADFSLREGLTFATEAGKIRPLKTVLRSAPLTFLRDIRQLELDNYDLVLTDFEPITAWAAKLRNKPVLGLGHQYAFNFPVPQHHGNLHQRLIMQYFAPAKPALGFHWYHFDMPILPPIAPVERNNAAIDQALIVVYLPFEDPAQIEQFLQPFKHHHFAVYHPLAPSSKSGHIQWHKPSKARFHADLGHCNGVVCNAGFELSSEVLQLGCKLLVRPVQGQIEQLSNVLALQRIGLGYTMDTLDHAAFSQWLDTGRGVSVRYPDVAGAVAQWLTQGDYSPQSIEALAAQLWRRSRFPRQPLFSAREIDSADNRAIAPV
ncbi:MAG: glycosyltransferase [Gammaproteobacteria bacterium]|nr:glycosyltransferase [Gammaproteobacteria bacterium]MBQ0839121.1 glycosyltransferase [Gammaproteobacteria bacterium]